MRDDWQCHMKSSQTLCHSFGHIFHFIGICFAHAASFNCLLHALAFWVLIQCIIDAHLAAKIQQLCVPHCLHAASHDAPRRCRCVTREWPVTLGLGGLGTAPRSLPGQLGHMGGTGGIPGLPKCSPEELDFVASWASGVIRKGAPFSHFLLCTNAFSVGNHKG